MERYIWFFTITMCMFFSSCVKKEVQTTVSPKAAVKGKKLVFIQKFDKNKFNNGGVWEDFPNDKKVSFVGKITKRVKVGPKGGSFRLDYDLHSGKDTVGGIWLSVAKYDFSKYTYFGFWIKGESELGYPRIVGVTLEDAKGHRDTRMISNVSSKWQKIEIPLRQLKLKDLSHITEINVVVDKRYATQQIGRFYLDNFYLR